MSVAMNSHASPICDIAFRAAINRDKTARHGSHEFPVASDSRAHSFRRPASGHLALGG
jgi:hypothetical protein